MKLLLYVVAGTAAMSVAAVVIFGNQALASHSTLLIASETLFVVHPLGTFWMMYMSIRYEKDPFPFILLALLPFTFLWYYVERVVPRQSVP